MFLQYCDFLYISFKFLNFKYSKSLLLLLFIIYLSCSGNFEKFEVIFFKVLQCLHYFFFNRFFFFFNIDVIFFLNIVYKLLIIDFKLLIRSTRFKYILVTFDMLIIKHDFLYQKNLSVLNFILNLKKKKKKLKKYSLYVDYIKVFGNLSGKKKIKKRKMNKLTYRYLREYFRIQNKGKNSKQKKDEYRFKKLTVIPFSVSLDYKRLKGFFFLIKSACLQKHLSFVLRFVIDIFMTFFKCSLCYYVKLEIIKIFFSNKANLKFK